MAGEIEVAEVFRELIRDQDLAHPVSDGLVAYHLRELPRDRAEAIREHLAACPACVSELQQLALFADPEDEPERISIAPPTRLPWQQPLLLAASLVVGLGLGLWLDPGRLDSPGIDVPRRDVDLTTDSFRGQTAVRAIGVDFPADRESVLLEVHLDYRPDVQRYRLDLYDSEGSRMLGGTVKPLHAGYLNLELPRRLLEPGIYRLEVQPITAGIHEDPAVAEVEIRFADPE